MANKARKINFSAARKVALASVSRAAFASGNARSAVVAATFAAAGKRPIQSLYDAVKLELQCGFMAAALARKGDNRPEATLIEHCRTRLTKYQGFGGTAKLRAGSLGRRTKVEEDAYASARVLVSGVFKDAGVTVPEARGGDTSKTRRAAGGKPAKAAKAGKTANDNRPATPKVRTAGQLLEYANVQAAALLATMNKNARIAPPALTSAVSDFALAVKKITID